MNQRTALDETIALAEKSGMPVMVKTSDALGLAHLRGMRRRITEDFSEAKLGRWLGWAQAALVAANVGVTLEDVKQLNLRHSEVVTALPQPDLAAGDTDNETELKILVGREMRIAGLDMHAEESNQLRDSIVRVVLPALAAARKEGAVQALTDLPQAIEEWAGYDAAEHQADPSYLAAGVRRWKTPGRASGYTAAVVEICELVRHRVEDLSSPPTEKSE